MTAFGPEAVQAMGQHSTRHGQRSLATLAIVLLEVDEAKACKSDAVRRRRGQHRCCRAKSWRTSRNGHVLPLGHPTDAYKFKLRRHGQRAASALCFLSCAAKHRRRKKNRRSRSGPLWIRQCRTCSSRASANRRRRLRAVPRACPLR